MKALVTGVDGFAGPYLLNELLLKGYEVTGTYKYQVRQKLDNDAKLLRLDILNIKSAEKVFHKTKPDVVFHLAGISSPKFSGQNPKLTMKVNAGGTENILGAVEKIIPDAVVMLACSAYEYGIPKYVPITEDHPLSPSTIYGKSKMEAEKVGLEYSRKGLKVLLLRGFNHIGPNQSEEFVCASFAKQIAEIESGKTDSVKIGDLSTKRDFTDVRDVVRAYAMSIEKCDSGVPYNVCSGNSYSMRQILDMLIGMSSSKIKITEDPSRMRKSDIPELLGSSRKFSTKTGWHPKITIEKSIADILDYWRRLVK